MGSVNRGVHGDIDEDAAAAAGAPPTMARDAHAAADPAAADTATADPATDTAAAPPTDTAAAPPTPMLALPAPGDVTSLVTLNCATGEPVVLDHFGPVVVNSDGTLSRITNWERMDEREVSTSLTLTLTPSPPCTIGGAGANPNPNPSHPCTIGGAGACRVRGGEEQRAARQGVVI